MNYRDEDYLDDNGYDFWWDCEEYYRDDPDYRIDIPDITPETFEIDPNFDPREALNKLLETPPKQSTSDRQMPLLSNSFKIVFKPNYEL